MAWKNKEVGRAWHREYQREWMKNPENRLSRNESNGRSRDKIRREALSYYSLTGELSCPCGEKRLDALSLDHINNNGSIDRKEKDLERKGGVSFYQRLRREGYPPGYQTLCYNCNIVKHREHLRAK